MEEFKNNSHKAREEQRANLPAEKKEVKQVVSKVKVKKKNAASKFAENFISEDVNNVKSYLIKDVVLPAIINTIEDVVTNGIHMLLRGESGRGNGRRTNSNSVSYRSYYDNGRNERSYRDSRSSRVGFDYEDVVIDNRGEAEEVLDRMAEIMDSYDGIVSVGDLNDLLGISGSYTDNNYGWTNLRNADVVRVRDGYILKLPKATSIK